MALPLNVLIIGAGIIGLSTAINLRRRNHTITVLERHPTVQALGGSVGLYDAFPTFYQPNSSNS